MLTMNTDTTGRTGQNSDQIWSNKSGFQHSKSGTDVDWIVCERDRKKAAV